ncbi:hypothetical protein [uncultured Methanobrevibacter sp.]|uniref:hypothetical protein n=1 Tax=uncultured Methanobrevibacter sp. TaxID=253161 RepID=UPI002636C5F5|nr:hypothetical protein [uncultured Methanobrevibacter sp.]
MFKNSQKISISKHFLIATLFIVLLFTSFGVSMDDVCAADLNESADVIKSELNVEDKLENSQDYILNSNNVDESLVTSVQNDVVLGATHTLNGGTFKDITNAINNANSGDTIKLSGTFTPSKSSEKIYVSKKVTITSSSQAVLNGKGTSQIMILRNTTSGTVLSNLKFINGYATGLGGGVYIQSKNVKVSNCVFENNHALNGGGLYSSYNAYSAENLLIENCKFYKNSADRSAGAAGVFGNNTKIKNCIFDSNYADSDGIVNYGGAIQIGLDDPVSVGYVYNCQFLNNYVNPEHEIAHGGAGCVRTGTVYQNCVFINNSAGQGGALTYHASGTIKNCTFINNTAVYYGGALSTGFADNIIMDLKIDNCSFADNSAPLGGAAQLIGENIKVHDSKFDNNHVSQTGGAIHIVAEEVTIDYSSFNGNIANVDGGAVFVNGKRTTIHDSSFKSNEAIPDVNKLDDGLGGAIYINSTQATVENNKFYYNTARNGSAIYYDKSGDDLKLINNVLFENQAWVYALPIFAKDIYYGEVEEVKSIIYGGNNIADYDNLAVSNAIYNAADNRKIVVNGETPVSGATTSGMLYQDDREYNIDVLMTVVHEDGSVAYNNTLSSNCFGEVMKNLTNLKVGKYFVTARHFEDTYYKPITNTTTFRVIAHVDNKIRKSVGDEEINYEDVVVWTLNITNNGPNNATNVIITDVLPEGMIWLEDDTGGKYDPKTGILHVDFLAVGEVMVVNIITLVNKTGTIVNNVNITSDEFDHNLTNNFDEERINVQPASDLSVVKAVNQSMPKYNDLVKWTITVTNNGPDVAHDVKVQDVLPSSLVWVSDSGAGRYNHDSGIWTIGTLNVGSKAKLEIVTRVKATGTLKNDVSVSGREYDNNMTNNHDDEKIKVNPATDLAIAKVVNVTSANFGDLVKWTLTVRNNGPDAATGVKVSDVLPSGFVYVSSSKPYSNGVINIGSLAVGQSQSVDIVTRVNITGTFVNVASVTGNEYDYDLSNNRVERSILINPAADLAVEKAVNDTKPNYNRLVKWTITVVNNGPDVAHDVKVQDVLPSSLVWVSDSGAGKYNHNTGVWDVGTLNVGSNAKLDITTRVKSTGTLKNDVSVSGREYDYDLSNNKDDRSVNVNPSADLAIAKVVNVTAANFGDLVKWTLTVRNNGPDAATGVKVSDVLPSGFVYVSSSKPYSNGVINIGSLAVGQSQSVDIVTRVNITGSFVNVGSVNGNEYDYDLSNNRAERSILINPAADLVVEKAVNDTKPNYKNLVKWTITVVNNGPDVAHDVKVQDVLPKSLIFVSSTGNYNSNTGVWDVGTLNVGSTAKLDITTRTNATGIIKNDVLVSGREYDYDMSNNRNDESIDVKPATDLAVAKLVNVSSANFGDLVKWTLVVSNNGPDAATGVKVSDVLPRGFVYVSSSKPFSNGVINIGTLAVGQSQSVDIVTKVNITGTFVNVASVTGNEYDHDLSNNRAERSILINPASDLIVKKAVNDTKSNYNSLVKWTLTVANNGPDVAHDVKVRDVLPKSLIFVSSTGNYDSISGIWNVGTLNVGSTSTLSIISRVNATGVIKNDVSVSGREYDHDLSNNNDSQSIDVKPATDLAVVKLVNVTAANFADLVKWTITVTNNGPDVATGVKVSDVLPRGFVYVSSSKPFSNGVINIGSLAVGQSQSVDIVTRVNITGTFVNVASVTGNEYDHDLSNNRAEKSILINPASDLIVEKTVNETAPNYQDLVKWTLTVSNNGPDVAHDVKVQDVLPKSLVFISANGNYNPNSGIWNVGTLNNGARATLVIITKVNKTGIIENNVSVSAREYDYNKSNNNDTQKIDVPNATDLSVVKLVNTSIEDYHELIKWTIMATNNGPDKATGVYVMDILPEGLILVNYTASKGFYDNGMWSVCCLERGEVQTLDIICYINKTGKIMNAVNITGNEYDHDLSNNKAHESVFVPNACDVEVIKTVNETVPYFGDVIEWNITVVNHGPDRATEVYVFENLPEGLIYIDYVASKGVYDDEGMWYIPSLDNGESAYILLRCEVNTLESIINTASASSLEYDWNMSNNNDSQGLSANPVTDLSITKVINASEANYLSFVKWTLTVTNNGPNDATDIFVRDVIPNGLQLIRVEGEGEYEDSFWYVGDLMNGQSKTLDLICKIVATGEFENHANVWGTEYDPDLSNNEDDESLLVNPASDLSITKTVSKYKYNIGDLVKYSIKVVNNGPDKATNVEVMEIMDDSLVLKSFRASYGDFDEATDMWSIDELDVGDSASLDIHAIAEKPGVASNRVSVTSDNYDPDLTNNEDDVDVNVTEIPKKEDIPKNHHVTNPKKEISAPYQSILQNYISGNPLVMMMVSIVFLLLIPCGMSFSKRR